MHTKKTKVFSEKTKVFLKKDLSVFLKGLGLLKTSIFSANNKSVIHFYSTGNKNQLSCFHTIPIIKY